LKFGDAAMATASLVLIGLMLDASLLVAFGPLDSVSLSERATLAFFISFLVGSLIVGYVFSLKIQEESRINAIGGIVVLSTFALWLFEMAEIAGPLGSAWFKDYLSSMFNTSGWTNYDWWAYSAFSVALVDLVTLVISFIGLYVGSMLRKPKKT